MSEIRTGIISEGPLDQFIIQSIIVQSFPEKTFLFHNISPTEDEIISNSKIEGFGWGSVFRICSRLKNKIEMLKAAGYEFDLLVIHVDGDVMFLTYESARLTPSSNNLSLPCINNNLSIFQNCKQLRNVVESWTDQQHSIPTHKKIEYCIPYINSDIWFAYILYEDSRVFLSESLDKEILDRFLLSRTKKEKRLIRLQNKKIKKNPKVYRETAEKLSYALLQDMRTHFKQLDFFCSNLSQII